MTNEPRAMKEIHDIRARIYEEIKDMTPEQRAEHANEQARKLIDTYGLKLPHREPATDRRLAK